MPKPPWYGVSEPAHIKRIRVLFAAKLPERLQGLRMGWEQAQSGGAGSAAGANRAFRVAHDLSGTAEAFGGQQLGDLAGDLAEALRPYGTEGVSPTPEDVLIIEDLVAGVELAGAEFLSWTEWEKDHTPDL